jgi:uncharacterized SAM-binding protein YcdF (DUF218 family)
MTYIQPTLAVLVLAAFAASFGYWRSGKAQAGRLLVLAAGGLFFLSWPPVAQLTMRLLETPWPPRLFASNGGQAIVVLSSSVYEEELPMPEPMLGYDTASRCQYAAWLYNHWRPLPVLASGGASDGAQPYSAAMRTAIERDGVPPQDVWVEERSHSTHENAAYSAALLRGKGIRTIVLVTDAYHMRRAAACFRKEGMTVLEAPSDYRSYRGFHALDLLPCWQAIAWNEDAVHEAIGMAWYWMRGWI